MALIEKFYAVATTDTGFITEHEQVVGEPRLTYGEAQRDLETMANEQDMQGAVDGFQHGVVEKRYERAGA